MKKYIFEADKSQLEKPTEPKYIFCKSAQVTVCAETQDEAASLAAKKLREKYLGSGTVLGSVRLVAEYDLPADWSYGYGDGRGTGSAEDKKALAADCTR
ncbi:MAG: hypothetical protein IJ072_03970 [Oscillospiraceae bacterium]|nr:hypothetical protein [Oscillospiraceae bacterium]